MLIALLEQKATTYWIQFFCNDPLLVSDICVSAPFSASDRVTVNVSLNIAFDDLADGCSTGVSDRPNNNNLEASAKKVLNWHKADWSALFNFFYKF